MAFAVGDTNRRRIRNPQFTTEERLPPVIALLSVVTLLRFKKSKTNDWVHSPTQEDMHMVSWRVCEKLAISFQRSAFSQKSVRRRGCLARNGVPHDRAVALTAVSPRRLWLIADR